ncbi:MAG: hypothetical protein B6U88_00185, partial [Candidatus Aenigmarchaeota archaeon ex4484_56]
KPEEKISEKQICEEREKRCLNNNLQECKNNKWQTIEICEYGCNSTSFTCNPAPAQAEKPVEKPNYYIIIFLLLLLGLAGGIFYFSKYKK